MLGRKKILATAALAVLFATVAGCSTSPSRVSVEVDTCCEARFERYATYDLAMTDVPGFLEAYLRGGITPVLAAKGLQPVPGPADLSVRLIFNQIYLTPESTANEYFGDSVDPEIATRFMAAISVDVIDTRDDRLVWSGRLSRIHNDPHGQPRGNDHKMQGIIDGFEELFAEYPARLIDIDDPGP